MMNSTTTLPSQDSPLLAPQAVPENSTLAAGNANSADVYRSLSRAAVASCLLGLFGITAFATPFLVVVPLAGAILAVFSFVAFRKFPDELVGKPLAYLGASLCGGLLVLAPVWHGYVYATEVPEGYTRVSFSSLMSDSEQADFPTAEAVALDGKPVFIKGYIHPTSMDTMMAKRFVIVPDLGTCCFGGQPPLTHMIEVTLSGDQYATKNMRKQRLAGTLHVNPNLKPVDGLTGVFYQLRADILK